MSRIAYWFFRSTCALGLHFGQWHLQPNFHSHHGTELFRCDHCLHAGRVRIITWRQAKRRLSQQPKVAKIDELSDAALRGLPADYAQR